MTADELRERVLGFVRDTLDLDAELQGKRVVVETESEDVILILVTAAKIDHRLPA